jgi:hypothetical protein
MCRRANPLMASRVTPSQGLLCLMRQMSVERSKIARHNAMLVFFAPTSPNHIFIIFTSATLDPPHNPIDEG